MSRLVRGLTALVVLIAAIAVIPIALVRLVGNPLPERFTGFTSIWAALERANIADSTVIKALAIIVWLAWARLVISVVIEIAARVSFRPTPRVVGLGASQQWAASLVTSVLLLVGSLSNAGAAQAVTPPPIHAVAATLMPSDHGLQFSAVAQVDQLVTATHGQSRPLMSHSRTAPHRLLPGTHLVQRYESFWSIAETTLGDGARWGEIVEFNRGHEVAPGVIFNGTAERLLPGWELLIPQTANEAPSTANADIAAHVVRVHQGDTLSSIAQRELGSDTRWPQIWEANRHHDFQGATFDDPNVIMTGWELLVPYVAQEPLDAPVVVHVPVVEQPVVEQPVVEQLVVEQLVVEQLVVEQPGEVESALDLSVESHAAQTTAVVPDVIERFPAGRAMDATPAHSSIADGLLTASALDAEAAVPGGLGTAVLVSCGVLGAVTARRRQQLRKARVGSRFLQPSPIAAATEAALRSLGNGERVLRLDIAIRAAAGELARSFHATAVLAAIVERSGNIELILTQPVSDAPSPWLQTAADRWYLDASTDLTALAEAARRVNQPCPALAHIGSTPLQGSGSENAVGDLFVDLEALGLLTVDAATSDAVDVVRAIAAGVVVSPLAEIAHVITCGLDESHLGHISAQSAGSLDMALDLAAGALGSTAAATSGGTTTFALRSLQQGGEAWEPAIVLAADESEVVEAHVDSDLVSLTKNGGRGLAVVISRQVVGATWTLCQERTRWTLQPLGIEVIPVGLSRDDLVSVRSLIDEADQSLLSPVIAIGAARSAESYLDQSEVEPWVEPQWSLMIRLLGQIEVVNDDDAPVVFERSKALELVAWLSQHREHSTRSGARTALWEVNVRDATFANVVSDARRAMASLVSAPDGEEWLGRTLTEQLPLHCGVVTDAELLRLRLAHASRQTPLDAVQTLVPGLSLVRDIPFAGTSYLWPDAEGLTSQITLLVTAAATVLAGHYLVLGDTTGVFWATGQGLKVLAGHEELIALRMRAHARSGDLAGVRAEWESYERALNADAWSDGEPSPKLVSLRRELLSPSLIRA